MKKAVMQFTACCLAVGITLSSFGTVAFADNDRSMTLAGLSETSTVVSSSSTLVGLSETDTVVSTGGAQGATTTAETDTTAETADETIDPAAAASAGADTTDTTDVDTTSEETEVQTETEAVYDTSMSGQLAFAQCENYINVRAEASADGEVVGKVYNNGSVTILGQLGDWYEVQSGNVTGYVNAAYFATGEEAEEIASAVAYNVATVNAEGLWVHSEASEDSSTIAMVYSSDQLEVVAYEGDWMKVVLEDGTYGYINAWYVSYDTYYSTAETLEEEQERLDEQWLAYLAEQEAEAAAAEAAAAEAAAAETAAAEAAAATYTDTSSTTSSSTSSSSSLSEAQAAVDEAYQTYLEAQEAADAATQQADEQLVYDTYDEAVAAYQDYLSAVAAADELKYATTTDTSASTTTTDTSTAETTYTEASTSTETTYTETTYTEAAQTEAAQTEATTTSTSSSSSTGQSIANYAVQFVGNPYVYGGTSLTNGADCSGFTQSVFANFGISIPRTAAAQASSGTSVSLSDIQAGDLLFYSDGSGISHVALYIGNGQVVHASSSTTGIIISSYNYRTPVCARRYWS